RNFDDITNVFSTGEVNGNVNVGGLVGAIVPPFSSINGSFWDVNVYPTSAGGGTGLTSEEMQVMSIYGPLGWDISSQLDDSTVWYISDGVAVPQLRYFGNLTPPSSGGGGGGGGGGGSSGGGVSTD